MWPYFLSFGTTLYAIETCEVIRTSNFTSTLLMAIVSLDAINYSQRGHSWSHVISQVFVPETASRLHLRHLIDLETPNRLACLIVATRLDYCNAVLYDVTNKNIMRLQRVQNSSSHLLRTIPQSISSSTTVLALATGDSENFLQNRNVDLQNTFTSPTHLLVNLPATIIRRHRQRRIWSCIHHHSCSDLEQSANVCPNGDICQPVQTTPKDTSFRSICQLIAQCDSGVSDSSFDELWRRNTSLLIDWLIDWLIDVAMTRSNALNMSLNHRLVSWGATYRCC